MSRSGPGWATALRLLRTHEPRVATTCRAGTLVPRDPGLLSTLGRWPPTRPGWREIGRSRGPAGRAGSRPGRGARCRPSATRAPTGWRLPRRQFDRRWAAPPACGTRRRGRRLLRGPSAARTCARGVHAVGDGAREAERPGREGVQVDRVPVTRHGGIRPALALGHRTPRRPAGTAARAASERVGVRRRPRRAAGRCCARQTSSPRRRPRRRGRPACPGGAAAGLGAHRDVERGRPPRDGGGR